MKTLHNTVTYARFLRTLPAFLRQRLDPVACLEIVRERLENREEHFLSIARDHVYGNPSSPYRRMLEVAGCEEGDLKSLVRDRGLHDALRDLRAAGVYVTFEEFKGRAPLVRDGVEIPCEPDSFDNPTKTKYYQTSTGGSTGAGRTVNIDAQYMMDGAIEQCAFRSIQGFSDIPCAMWMDGLPGPGAGIVIKRIIAGGMPLRWFSPVHAGDSRPPAKFRWAEKGMLLTARLAGHRFPSPEPLPLDRADVVVRWLRNTLDEHGKAGLNTGVSRALRVALVAQDLGIDLAGTTVFTGGEPPTDAKVAAIEGAGMRFTAAYHFTEAGLIAPPCTNPASYDELHFAAHKLELVQFPRVLEGSGETVHSFHYTSLIGSTPKILFNTEIDDYGIVFERPCGCPLEKLGLVRHIRQIRSFSKLTGEGVTLVGSDMEHVLEHVLPARFGGTALDYQLLEEEDERGFTRLSVVVSPRVNLSDEGEVISTVLDALARGETDAVVSTKMWEEASTFRVKRTEPVWTSRGKLHPLHVRSRTRSAASADGAVGSHESVGA